MQTFENLTEEQIDSELIFDGRLLHVTRIVLSYQTVMSPQENTSLILEL